MATSGRTSTPCTPPPRCLAHRCRKEVRIRALMWPGAKSPCSHGCGGQPGQGPEEEGDRDSEVAGDDKKRQGKPRWIGRGSGPANTCRKNAPAVDRQLRPIGHQPNPIIAQGSWRVLTHTDQHETRAPSLPLNSHDSLERLFCHPPPLDTF